MAEIDQTMATLREQLAAKMRLANEAIDEHMKLRIAAEEERDELKRRNNDLAAEVAMHREFAWDPIPWWTWFGLGAGVAFFIGGLVSKFAR